MTINETMKKFNDFHKDMGIKYIFNHYTIFAKNKYNPEGENILWFDDDQVQLFLTPITPQQFIAIMTIYNYIRYYSNE